VKWILKIMTGAKLKLAVGISAAIILVAGTTTVVLWKHLARDHLPPDAIITKAWIPIMGLGIIGGIICGFVIGSFGV